MGGKRRLIKHILPMFPEHLAYVEPFCGGAAMFFAKPESKVEVVNDLNGDLVNLYRVLKYHLEEFLRHFKWALISREEFLWQQNTNPETLTDIQRASRFYYLQKLAFGAKATGQNFGVTPTRPAGLNLLRIEEDLSAAHLRLARTCIEHLSWDECVKRYDREGTLFYLDPPYWNTAGYGNDFGFEQYELMAALAASIQGKMVISVNDIPEMRQVFDGLAMKSLPINYSVGGNNRGKDRAELVIWNW
jgi:DNA adenine methylase